MPIITMTTEMVVASYLKWVGGALDSAVNPVLEACGIPRLLFEY